MAPRTPGTARRCNPGSPTSAALHAQAYVANIDGDSMVGAKIFHDSLVVVDRSRKPSSGSIVIAALNNEPLCKILILQGDHVVLKSANPAYPPRHILEGEELSIWGVVRHGVTSFE
nr:S24 family peptidase [Pseudomonas amygdali]